MIRDNLEKKERYGRRWKLIDYKLESIKKVFADIRKILNEIHLCNGLKNYAWLPNCLILVFGNVQYR